MERYIFSFIALTCFLIILYKGIRKEKRNLLDTIFIFIFLIFLCIPALYISLEKNDYIEYRSLNIFPSFKINGKINNKFGEQFEKYFNDRFFLRKNFQNIFAKLSLINNIIKRNDTIHFKDSNFMYQENNYYIDFNSDAIKRLNEFDKYLKNKGIKLYILVPPKKRYVYSKPFENYDNTLTQKTLQKYKYQKLQQNTNIKNRIIYPLDDLENSPILTYYKTDHHWTDFGAYIAYHKLMKEIKKDFPDIYIAPLTDFKYSQNTMIEVNEIFIDGDTEMGFDIGSESRQLHYIDDLQKRFENTPYHYYGTTNMKKDGNTYKSYGENKNGKYTIYVYGNSFSFAILKYLLKSANKIKFTYASNSEWNERFKFKKYAEKDLEKYKPDIFILLASDYELLELNKFDKLLSDD